MSSKEDTIQIDESAWVHESALLFGHISVGRESSIWPNAVMRAEMFHIGIGARTNIQDFVFVRETIMERPPEIMSFRVGDKRRKLQV